MKSISSVVCLICALACSHSNAYEQATHAFITNYAFAASALSDSSDGYAPLMRQLGLDSLRAFGLNEQYVEFAGTATNLRDVQLFERRIIADLSKWLNSIDSTTLWLMYGAIREDDNPAEDPATPQDVAPGLKRPLHHFYDPYRDRPLTVPLLDHIDSDVHKDPDWAIGSRNSFANPNDPEVGRRNTFTVIDAREAMFRALTLLAKQDQGFGSLATGDGRIDEQWRQAYWATTFRALGDVLHLNQDMAQPQHTRNEAHSGKYCSTAVCPAGHTSVYEKYVNARALKINAFNSLAPFHTPVNIALKPLVMDGYPVPAFSRYTDYWATSPSDPLVRGKGLAEFSNRGFFSAGKNLGSQEYWYPTSDVGEYVIRDQVLPRWDGSTPSDLTPAKVYYGKVLDTLEDLVYLEVPQTTFGVWDQFLQKKSKTPRYSLNRLNYDAMADLLLPRAVAYSAGLINFFFRGRVAISLPDEGAFAVADHSVNTGFTKVRAKIKNATPSFVDPQGTDQPQNMQGGTFFAVVRYHKDKRYADSLENVVGIAPCDSSYAVIDAAKPEASTQCRDAIEQIVVSRPVPMSLGADEEKSVDFSFVDSPVPYAMTDVTLQVVYRGALGSETDAVAVGTIDVSEPTYFTYQNDSDYIHLASHVYTRPQIAGSPDLLALVKPEYCVDYRQSPPALSDTCLQPFLVDLKISFGDLSKPIATVDRLPSRRFTRIAWLTTAEEPFNPPVKSASRARVSVHVQPHGGLEKALVYQDGTCFPLEPFDVPPRHSQMTVVSPSQIGYRLDRLSTLRGVNGWYSTSCVQNGDASTPGAPDDRNTVMGPLLPDSDEVRPFGATIMSAYL